VTAHDLSLLDLRTLTRRLGELAGAERAAQVDFLLCLDEFDRRRAYLEVGFGSLWDYCLQCLHLREGAAGRRIGAMRVLRRFPKLAVALRDGRVCISTVTLLAQVLTDENLDAVLERAAFRTKAEVEHLVVSLRPTEAPREGIRKLPARETVANVSLALISTEDGAQRSAGTASAAHCQRVVLTPPTADSPAAPAAAQATSPAAPAPRRTVEVRAVAEDRWSLRATLDAEALKELETLKSLLSHKVPDGNLATVLREAIRCGIEKHGKRRGAVAPKRERSTDEPAANASPRIPAAVRRAVWKRDGGCCTWTSGDGRRCGSRWQLELDHIRPLAQGGTSTLANLRIRCKGHNMLYAEQVYGREHMDLFRREAPRSLAVP
jgi:hypothetical protein